jgi:hypothetical protein
MKNNSPLNIFKKDLNLAIFTSIKNDRFNKFNTKNIFIFGVFLGVFVLWKPVIIYYKGKFERINKIKQLKSEGKFVLDDQNELNV